MRQRARDQLILELNEDLPEGIPLAGTRRWIPGQRLTEPRLAVFFGPKEGVSRRHLSIDDRELILSLQAVVAVEEPAAADDALEPILRHIAERLGDTNLQGLATSLDEAETEWQSASMDLFYHQAVVRYRLRYQSKRGDLTKQQ